MTSDTTMNAAKWAFTTRRVLRDDARGLNGATATAVSGDLVLAEVTEIGQHQKIQLAEGRFSALYPGDLVVLACGDRYAPDQFEAVAELDDAAEMIAGGGLVGRMRQSHEAMRAPTRVRPLGLLSGADGETLNLAAYALSSRPRPDAITVIGVVGASMNAGKTTAAAALAHGLTRAGCRVAAIKATGTGAFGDFNTFADAGAHFVADFTDAGMASTYRQPIDRIAAALDTLLGHAAEADVSVAVVELADGVFQQETAEILATPALRAAFHGFMLAAPDALSAAGGVMVMARNGLRPLAMSGLISRSPLASAEAIAETGVEILTRQALCAPEQAMRLLRAARPTMLADAA